MNRFAILTAAALALGGWGIVGCEQEPVEPTAPPPTAPADDPAAPPTPPADDPATDPGADLGVQDDDAARPAGEQMDDDPQVGPPQDDGPGGEY